jgi:FkbM family methyltransferase
MVVKDTFGYVYLEDKDNVYIKHSLVQYDVSDILPDDIVIDIGANIGSFSFRVAPLCKMVYAVEPFRFEVLAKNIERNGIKNVIPMLIAHGTGDSEVLEWNDIYKILETKRIPEIIKMCGGHCDYLKIDTEGSEWTIDPEELKDIRRIEIELHGAYPRKKQLMDDPFICGVSKYFDFTISTFGTDVFSVWLHGISKVIP